MSEEGSRRIAVVDGANVAHAATSDGQPLVANIVAMRKALVEQGYDPVIIVDASLHHEIDDPHQFEGLLEAGKLRQAPAGTDADYFVIQVADEEDAVVVSNDRFEEYREKYPWIGGRRIPFMIVRGDVYLYTPEDSAD